MRHKIVSRDEWLKARKVLLAKEKEFSKARDALNTTRRELPWTPVDKNYVFDGPNGKEALADLFGGKSQLMVYHFMLGPGWAQGCPSCSFLADHFDGPMIKDEMAKGAEYNYSVDKIPSEELPGLSAFIQDEEGKVFHTYSSYARGLDTLVGTDNFLDMAPKGRDERALPWSMAWVRRHDEYQEKPKDGSCCA